MKNHLWFALFAFILLSSIIANGQMYTYHDAWFDANGNVVADNATYGSGGYGKSSFAYTHIQMPSGAVSSNTASGNAYAEAVTQKSSFGEDGLGFFSGYNEVSDICWDTSQYSDFQEPIIFDAYQVEPIDTASESQISCTSGFGWERWTTNQVQYFDGSAFAFAGMTVADKLTPRTTTNALGISGTETGYAPTTGDGSFTDHYYVCSTACPQSSGESDVWQSWTVDSFGLPHINLVVYKCSSIKIDGR